MGRKKLTKGIQIANEITKRVYKDGYKPSNPQTLQHINAVRAAYNYILNGGTASTLKSALTEDRLGLGIEYSSKQAERIFWEARELIIADFNEERTYAKTRMLACLNDIYTECRETKDKSNAINAVKEMCKLLNLYEENKPSLKVETKEGVTISFGFNNNDEDTETETVQYTEEN